MVQKGRSRNGENHYLTTLTAAEVRAIVAECKPDKSNWGEVVSRRGITRHWLARLMRGAIWRHVTGIKPVKLEEPLVSNCPRCGKEVVRRTLHAKAYCSQNCQQVHWKQRAAQQRRQQEAPAVTVLQAARRSEPKQAAPREGRVAG